MLFRLELDDDQHLQSTALAVYTFGQWIDLASLVAPLVQNIDLAKLAEGDLASVLTDAFKSFDFSNASMESSPLLQAVLGSLFAPKQFISQLLFTIQRGAVNEIPGTGLENVGTLDKESFPLLELLNDQEKLRQLTGQTAASGEDYGDPRSSNSSAISIRPWKVAAHGRRTRSIRIGSGGWLARMVATGSC